MPSLNRCQERFRLVLVFQSGKGDGSEEVNREGIYAPIYPTGCEKALGVFTQAVPLRDSLLLSQDRQSGHWFYRLAL